MSQFLENISVIFIYDNHSARAIIILMVFPVFVFADYNCNYNDRDNLMLCIANINRYLENMSLIIK